MKRIIKRNQIVKESKIADGCNNHLAKAGQIVINSKKLAKYIGTKAKVIVYVHYAR